MAKFVEEGWLVLRGVRHGDALGLVEMNSCFLAGWGKFEAGKVVESVGGAVGVCTGIKIKSAANEDGGLLLPNRSKGIADLEWTMGESEGADRAIDCRPEGAIFNDRDQAGPREGQRGDGLEFGQKV